MLLTYFIRVRKNSQQVFPDFLFPIDFFKQLHSHSVLDQTARHSLPSILSQNIDSFRRKYRDLLQSIFLCFESSDRSFGRGAALLPPLHWWSVFKNIMDLESIGIKEEDFFRMEHKKRTTSGGFRKEGQFYYREGFVFGGVSRSGWSSANRKV